MRQTATARFRPAPRMSKPPGEGSIDDDRRENAFGLLMSLNMLIETAGGFDYTGPDCERWMREAGFSETYVQHLVGPDSMVVGIK